MKFTVNINQKAVKDAGFDLDLIDMAIFDVLTVFVNSTACRRMNDGDAIYFNVPYQLVIDELPLAKINKTDSIYRRFQKLEMYSVIEMHPDNKKMKQVWFKWGRNYSILYSDSMTGFKSVQTKKQAVRPDLNPIQTGFKSVLRPDLNPPHNNTNHYTIISESTPAPAQTEISSDLNTELPYEKKEVPPPAAPILPPNWAARPKAHTADELRAELASFYRPYPEQWRATIDGTPAANWPADKTKDVVENFCAWAIGEGYNGRTFQQINARLKRWFKDEPIMSRQQAPAPANTSTTLPKTMKVYGS